MSMAVRLTLLILAAGQAVASAEPALGIRKSPLRQLLSVYSESPLLEGARISIYVLDLETATEVFAKNPDSLVNPASVTKIFTTAAALCLLHPDYRFKVEVLADKEPVDGILRGRLYLKGYGDPWLVEQRLLQLAMKLKVAGLKQFSGTVVVDDSFFDDRRWGPGWEQEIEGHEAYLAPVGALSADFNTVRVLVFPGKRIGARARISLVPNGGDVRMAGTVTTSGRYTRIRLEMEPGPRRDRIKIAGRIHYRSAGWEGRVRVSRPALHAGYAFAEALRQLGVRCRCHVRRGQAPQRAKHLATTWSPPLSEMIRKVNKYSQNFMAEVFFKTLGAEILGPPGSWEKGRQVMSQFIKDNLGMPPGTYVLHNGSGLNDVNRVSARQVVELLRYMWGRFDARADFLASLALAGADGTVDGRFERPGIIRNLRVKTGGLHNVRALAGYASNRAGHTLAFAFLASDFNCSGKTITGIIDSFASALVESDASLRVDESALVVPESAVEFAGP